MEALNLRRKLIKQFDAMINNDDKLIALEGVFDVLNSPDSISNIPDEHYDRISESRTQYLEGAIQGISWEELKQNLNSKYGL